MTDESQNILLILEVGEKLQELAPTALDPPFACVAWSGGADSTALLLTYLDLLRYRHGSPLPAPLIAVHIDHGLREESGEDASWCRRLAESIGDDLEYVELRIPRGALTSMKGSLEQNARLRRYAMVGQAARARGVTFVLTAHHADDNLESLLLGLIRGSGLTGLAGTRARIALSELSGRPDDCHVTVVRPLLDIPRVELVFMLRQRDQDWREDASNVDLGHRRNMIRHKVVPLLRSIADSDGPLLRSPSVLRSERTLLEEITSQHLNKVLRPLPSGYSRGVCLSRHRLQRLSPGLINQVLRAGIRRSGNPLPPDREALGRLVAALDAAPTGTTTVEIKGTQVDFLPDRLVILGAGGPTLAETPDPSILPVPGRVTWGDFVIKANLVNVEPGQAELWVAHLKQARTRVRQGLRVDDTQLVVLPDVEGSRFLEIFDAATVKFPLRVRPPKPGESVPTFGGHTPPLARVLIDAKVPRASRPFIPVVETADAEFLWAASVVRGSASEVGADTTRVLMLDLLVLAT